MSSKIINDIMWESKNKNWKIIKAGLKNHARIRVEGVSHVDYPIKYDDGRIAYDFPERVPKYVQKALSGLM